jgi:hypothetical protein
MQLIQDKWLPPKRLDALLTARIPQTQGKCIDCEHCPNEPSRYCPKRNTFSMNAASIQRACYAASTNQ